MVNYNFLGDERKDSRDGVKGERVGVAYGRIDDYQVGRACQEGTALASSLQSLSTLSGRFPT